MKVLITGAHGFVGKNLVTTLNQMEGYELDLYDRDNTHEELVKMTQRCDFVIHLAGINRPTNPSDFYEGNASFTEVLCSLLRQHGNKAPVLVSSSIQADRDNDYGKSKLEGETILRRHGEINESRVFIYRFANLYGKWCRPNYNSVIATWCHNVAHDLEVVVNDPHVVIPFVYIDDVVAEIINAMKGYPTQIDGICHAYPIDHVSLEQLLSLLMSFKASRKDLMVPNITTRFAKNLYSTYLSYLPTDAFSYKLVSHVDDRGSFTEFLKTEDLGQVSINISKPGITKGQHWHHTKTEKFLVVNGSGQIQFRNILNNDIITYAVSAETLEVVDIPTGYTHNITNTGSVDMVTIMWANETFDSEKPDTFYETV